MKHLIDINWQEAIKIEKGIKKQHLFPMNSDVKISDELVFIINKNEEDMEMLPPITCVKIYYYDFKILNNKLQIIENNNVLSGKDSIELSKKLGFDGLTSLKNHINQNTEYKSVAWF